MRIRLLLIGLGFCAIGIYAGEIPILDLSKGHGYSLIAKGRISFHPKTSFVLDTNLEVKLGSNRTFTISSQENPWAVIDCPDGKTNIELVWLYNVFLSVESTKQKLWEMQTAFSWNDDDFTNWPHLEQGNRMQWFKINEDQLPYYVLKVGLSGKLPGLPMPLYPYTIELIIAWDKSRLEQKSAEVGMIRRKSELEKAMTLADREPPINIPKAPEAVVKLYLDLLNKKNFVQAARLLDSGGIKQFRQTLSYFDRGSGSEFGDGERKLHFGENATLESVARLSDEEFIGKWTEGRALIFALLFNDDFNDWSDVEITSSAPDGENKLRITIRVDRKTMIRQYPPIGYSDLQTILLHKQLDGSWRNNVSQDLLKVAAQDAERIEEK